MMNGIDLCNGTRFRFWWKINVLFNSAAPRWKEHQYLSPYAKSRTIARSTIQDLYKIDAFTHRSCLTSHQVQYGGIAGLIQDEDVGGGTGATDIIGGMHSDKVLSSAVVEIGWHL